MNVYNYIFKDPIYDYITKQVNDFDKSIENQDQLLNDKIQQIEDLIQEKFEENNKFNDSKIDSQEIERHNNELNVNESPLSLDLQDKKLDKIQCDDVDILCDIANVKSEEPITQSIDNEKSSNIDTTQDINKNNDCNESNEENRLNVQELNNNT